MRVAVIGAGAWGTTLAKHLSESGQEVRLWCREEEARQSIAERCENELFLPGIALPAGLVPSVRLDDVTSRAELVVLAVPSQFLRGVLRELASRLDRAGRPLLLSATKGIEEGTLLRMSEVIGEELGPSRLAVLSGPTFAREVATGEPTAAVVASSDRALAYEAQAILSARNLRIYTNEDVIGVELGGSLKNVIAIAAGVAAGMGLGFNPLAALITRGLAEISRLCEALGGRRSTLAGLSGMGDLVLTCTGGLSRNRHVGVELGKGRPLAEIVAETRAVAEGVATTHAAVALARRHSVEMPIAFAMERLLRGEITSVEGVRELMERPLGGE